jgi:hypothetical protein
MRPRRYTWGMPQGASGRAKRSIGIGVCALLVSLVPPAHGSLIPRPQAACAESW